MVPATAAPSTSHAAYVAHRGGEARAGNPLRRRERERQRDRRRRRCRCRCYRHRRSGRRRRGIHSAGWGRVRGRRWRVGHRHPADKTRERNGDSCGQCQRGESRRAPAPRRLLGNRIGSVPASPCTGLGRCHTVSITLYTNGVVSTPLLQSATAAPSGCGRPVTGSNAGDLVAAFVVGTPLITGADTRT